MYTTRMPFGKHRGRPLCEVPANYLTWLLRKCDLSPWLEQAVQDELSSRELVSPGRKSGARTRRGCNHLPALDWAGIIRTWYREQALLHHPDRAGPESTAIMAAITAARERLEQLVRAKVG